MQLPVGTKPEIISYMYAAITTVAIISYMYAAIKNVALWLAS